MNKPQSWPLPGRPLIAAAPEPRWGTAMSCAMTIREYREAQAL